MVVDDDPDVRASLREVLVEAGYQVTCVGNGREALERLQNGTRPCVILLDLIMPVMDGYQFRREQKRNPSIADIPLIVITAMRSGNVLVDADALVMKPLNIEELFRSIARHCPTV